VSRSAAEQAKLVRQKCHQCQHRHGLISNIHLAKPVNKHCIVEQKRERERERANLRVQLGMSYYRAPMSLACLYDARDAVNPGVRLDHRGEQRVAVLDRRDALI